MEYTPFEQGLLKNWVVSQETTRIGKKTTVVCLIMKNGFEVLGTSACVNPEMFDLEIGTYWATKDALNKLEPIVGYAMQEELLRATSQEQKGREGREGISKILQMALETEGLV